MAEMLYNTSKLYYMWAKKENISNKAMARYWHGEHESFIYERRIAITKGWEDGIKKARKMMQSQKSALNQLAKSEGRPECAN